jgi:hypothetical protein
LIRGFCNSNSIVISVGNHRLTCKIIFHKRLKCLKCAHSLRAFLII